MEERLLVDLDPFSSVSEGSLVRRFTCVSDGFSRETDVPSSASSLRLEVPELPLTSRGVLSSAGELEGLVPSRWWRCLPLGEVVSSSERSAELRRSLAFSGDVAFARRRSLVSRAAAPGEAAATGLLAAAAVAAGEADVLAAALVWAETPV